MQEQESSSSILRAHISRRKVLASSAAAAVSAAFMRPGFGKASPSNPSPMIGSPTVAQINAALLYAQAIALTYYYNGMITSIVAQDTLLAGSGGSLFPTVTIGSGGNGFNSYNLRDLVYNELEQFFILDEFYYYYVGGSGFVGTNFNTFPIQTAYFPSTSFANATNFLNGAIALEQILIAFYLGGIYELALLGGTSATSAFANRSSHLQPNGSGAGIQQTSAYEYLYLNEILASAGAIHGENRVFLRTILNAIPANDLTYEKANSGYTVAGAGANAASSPLAPYLHGGNGQLSYQISAAISALD